MISVIAGDKINWRRFWKRFTSHEEKFKTATHLEDMFLDHTFPDNLKDYFGELKAQVQDLERGKQKSLYCNFTENIPYVPSEIFGENMATNALKWAKSRVNLFSWVEDEYKKSGILEKISKQSIENFRKEFGITKLFESEV